jgi:hypothetical protein
LPIASSSSQKSARLPRNNTFFRKVLKIVRERFGAFQRTGNDRRHLISTIFFVAQTKDTAHAAMFGLLTNVKDGKAFTALTNLNYEGWFAKTNGVWKITRWIDAPSSSPM